MSEVPLYIASCLLRPVPRGLTSCISKGRFAGPQSHDACHAPHPAQHRLPGTSCTQLPGHHHLLRRPSPGLSNGLADCNPKARFIPGSGPDQANFPCRSTYFDVYAYVYIYVDVYIYMYICIYTCICICICVCEHIYIRNRARYVHCEVLMACGANPGKDSI